MKSFALLFILFSALTSQALNPRKDYRNQPAEFGLTHTETKIYTSDGATLNTWFIESPIPTKQLVILCHSGQGNMGDYLLRASKFLELGYNVFMFDYRGFGSSSEFEINNKMYIYSAFVQDVIAVTEYCRENRAESFHIYGFGIGAGLGLGVGYNRDEVKRIIVDTPFLSMEDLESRFTQWDEPMEVPSVGYDKKYQPLFALDQAPKKTLQKIQLIIGSSNYFYKLEDMETLKAKQPELIKDIQVINNPENKDNFMADEDGYKKILSNALRSE
jgi:pimeloyl-ACP methyl ester carboxylesterase